MSEGPLPDGNIQLTITFLEMAEPPSRPALHPPHRLKLALMRAERPTISFYRYLYDTVGGPWYWWERRQYSDKRLAAAIHDDRVEVYVLYVGGVPAGYAELDRRQGPEVIDLAYFGLIPEYIGMGLGPYLLDWAIRHAWSYGPQRVTVNTCTLDHPKALPMYQRAGFRPLRQVTRVIEDPAGRNPPTPSPD
jgi:GNAT superfamily N-acetyltransferase